MNAASEPGQQEQTTETPTEIHLSLLVSDGNAVLGFLDEPAENPLVDIVQKQGILIPSNSTCTISITLIEGENVESVAFPMPSGAIEWFQGLEALQSVSQPSNIIDSHVVNSLVLEFTVENSLAGDAAHAQAFRLNFTADSQSRHYDPILIELPAGGTPTGGS